MVPNLRFAAPEVTKEGQLSVQSDLWSVGCFLYFLSALSKGQNAFYNNITEITNKNAHIYEIQSIERKQQ